MSKVELGYNIPTDLHHLEVKALSHTTLEVARKTPYKQQEFKMLTQNLLHELYTYDADQGTLVRKIARGHNISIGDVVGTPNGMGYLKTGIGQKKYYVHRLIWLYVNGEEPCGQIDHINHNRADNRIENLRVVGHRENSLNTKLPSDNTSGTIGVSFYKARNKWVAKIKNEGKYQTVYYGNSKEDAIRARKEAEIIHGYHTNHGGTECH